MYYIKSREILKKMGPYEKSQQFTSLRTCFVNGPRVNIHLLEVSDNNDILEKNKNKKQK